MPHAGEPVGPIPPGLDAAEYDRTRRRVLWSLPTGLYVVGSRAGERRNLMTLSLAVQLSTDPKLVGVAVESGAVTHGLISEGRAFALSLMAREDRVLVRRFVKPCEWDAAAGTLNGEPVHERATASPVLDRAVAFLDCRLERRVDLGAHSLFVGEVVEAGFLRPEDTPVLRMEDTRMSYGG